MRERFRIQLIWKGKLKYCQLCDYSLLQIYWVLEILHSCILCILFSALHNHFSCFLFLCVIARCQILWVTKNNEMLPLSSLWHYKFTLYSTQQLLCGRITTEAREWQILWSQSAAATCPDITQPGDFHLSFPARLSLMALHSYTSCIWEVGAVLIASPRAHSQQKVCRCSCS